MPDQSWWSRVREARIVRLLAVYLAASWAVLQATDLFIERFGVPAWVAPTALLLLLVGLVVLLATAWVQSHPHTPKRADAEEVPQGWELDVGDLGRSLKSGKLPHLTWARAAAGWRDEARAAYEFFLDAWRDADPDPAVQKLVSDARAGLSRLGFRPRG